MIVLIYTVTLIAIVLAIVAIKWYSKDDIKSLSSKHFEKCKQKKKKEDIKAGRSTPLIVSKPYYYRNNTLGNDKDVVYSSDA